jgi:NTP pyrophosphatase (non-canonical NTP hydrolase)
MTSLDLGALSASLRAFAEARDWPKFHTPKNLAMALSVEVAELVELFQWLTPDESVVAADAEPFASALADEIADVLIYLVELSDSTGIDIATAVEEKMLKNAAKHPAPSAE